MEEHALTLSIRGLSPFTTNGDLAIQGMELRDAFLYLADQMLHAEVPDIEEEYNGAEYAAIKTQRAIEIYKAASDKLDMGAGFLLEEADKTLPFHPEGRDPQELIGEILTKGNERRIRQGKFFVADVIPQYVQYYEDDPSIPHPQKWLSRTTRNKIYEVIGTIRIILSDPMTAEDRKRDFLWAAGLMHLPVTQIRTALTGEEPMTFWVYETPTGDTYEWLIQDMTLTSRMWMSRRMQPHGRLAGPNGEIKIQEEQIRKGIHDRRSRYRAGVQTDRDPVRRVQIADPLPQN